MSDQINPSLQEVVNIWESAFRNRNPISSFGNEESMGVSATPDNPLGEPANPTQSFRDRIAPFIQQNIGDIPASDMDMWVDAMARIGKQQSEAIRKQKAQAIMNGELSQKDKIYNQARSLFGLPEDISNKPASPAMFYKDLNSLTPEARQKLYNTPGAFTQSHRDMVNGINDYMNDLRARMPKGISAKDIEQIASLANDDDAILNYVVGKFHNKNEKDNDSLNTFQDEVNELRQVLNDFRGQASIQGYDTSMADAALAYLHARDENNHGRAKAGSFGLSANNNLATAYQAARTAKETYKAAGELANLINQYDDSYNALVKEQNSYLQYQRAAEDLFRREKDGNSPETVKNLSRIARDRLGKYSKDMAYFGDLYNQTASALNSKLLDNLQKRREMQIMNEL